MRSKVTGAKRWVVKIGSALLTADGRSMPQGALAWVLGASERTIPIPGFTSAAQIHDNVEAVWQGRLSADAMARLKDIVAGG